MNTIFNDYYHKIKSSLDSKCFLNQHLNFQHQLIEDIVLNKNTSSVFLKEVYLKQQALLSTQNHLNSYTQCIRNLNQHTLQRIKKNLNISLSSLSKFEIQKHLMHEASKNIREDLWSEVYERFDPDKSFITSLLKRVLRKRQTIAHELGYESYSDIRTQRWLNLSSNQFSKILKRLHLKKKSALKHLVYTYSQRIHMSFESFIDRRHIYKNLKDCFGYTLNEKHSLSLIDIIHLYQEFHLRNFNETLKYKIEKDCIQILLSDTKTITFQQSPESLTIAIPILDKKSESAFVYLPTSFFKHPLSLIQAKSLCHELGHALSFLLLSHPKKTHPVEDMHQGLYEVHSQILEKTFFQYVLKQVSILENPKKYFAILDALDDIRQVELALLDLFIHSNDFDFETLPLSEPINYGLKNSELKPGSYLKNIITFSHIFFGGYEGQYWVYPMNELIAQKAVEDFENQSHTLLFNQTHADVLHKTIQSLSISL